MRRLICLLLACVLGLSGCSWPDGSYHSVTPHREPSGSLRTENMTVSHYEELEDILEAVILKGAESSVIHAEDYDPELLEKDLAAASRYVRQVYPVGAYAVENLHYEIGSSSGRTAIALNISYRHTRTEIRNIRHVRDLDSVYKLIGSALTDVDAVLVFQMAEFQTMDVAQMVQDYAMEYPQLVMELPQVTAEVFGIGTARIMELTFTYQTSRDALRTMQTQVKPVFDSAVLYVSGEGSESQKFSQLYAFLMERFDYKIDTSITPAYSLLRHGVGDGRAFATVYAAMCRAAGLDCGLVTGTRSGEPWTWNITRQEDGWYHVDLLRCNENGRFTRQRDEEMEGYVWDYSAFSQEEGTEKMAPPEKDENRGLTNRENVI